MRSFLRKLLPEVMPYSLTGSFVSWRDIAYALIYATNDTLPNLADCGTSVAAKTQLLLVFALKKYFSPSWFIKIQKHLMDIVIEWQNLNASKSADKC